VSGAMSVFVAVFVGIIVFSLISKYTQQLTFGLMAGVLTGILAYFVTPQVVEVKDDAIQTTGKKATKNLDALKNPDTGKFKSLKDLKQELGASEQAMDDRLKELEDMVEK